MTTPYLGLIHVELGGHCFHLSGFFLETGLVHRKLLRHLWSRLHMIDNRGICSASRGVNVTAGFGVYLTAETLILSHIIPIYYVGNKKRR